MAAFRRLFSEEVVQASRRQRRGFRIVLLPPLGWTFHLLPKNGSATDANATHILPQTPCFDSSQNLKYGTMLIEQVVLRH